MRLVEIDGRFFNPDSIAFLREITTMGGQLQTIICFSGNRDDEVKVALPISQVVELLRNG